MSTPEATALPLGKVVGENLKRHREEMRWTQHEMSQWLRRNGVNWSRAQIAAMESGAREGIDAGILVALAAALNIGITDLLLGEGDVLLSSDLLQNRQGVRSMLSGKLNGDLDPRDQAKPGFGAVEFRYEADLALAKRLGVNVQDVLDVARDLYNKRTLTEERDLRVKVLAMDAGDAMDIGEQQAHRGHITRELSKEIEAALSERGDDQ